MGSRLSRSASRPRDVPALLDAVPPPDRLPATPDRLPEARPDLLLSRLHKLGPVHHLNSPGIVPPVQHTPPDTSTHADASVLRQIFEQKHNGATVKQMQQQFRLDPKVFELLGGDAQWRFSVPKKQ
ncbi:hypothetical protein NEOLI_003038 [Neolecta irregularis DAH-3]|uniref:Uncharacterized protein n=1 Tax=Neolecta irregularis (strain DAH-3) TaxID=1198029 RepID=A0A1U7LTY5_NEOID|nr:hypothetical protein NEOLI_003038 [Neolecta irregularis DAH-3]|eukprot:OLL26136.1 hypothetical protein NEOLI_003038 [Neolecta irregularis DAH-3]